MDKFVLKVEYTAVKVIQIQSHVNIKLSRTHNVDT